MILLLFLLVFWLGLIFCIMVGTGWIALPLWCAIVIWMSLIACMLAAIIYHIDKEDKNRRHKKH